MPHAGDRPNFIKSFGFEEARDSFEFLRLAGGMRGIIRRIAD